MKIHLGSGNKYRDGWVNVDMYAERADVREDLRTVSFPTGEARQCDCFHALEHFTRGDCLVICRNVFRWLRTGGDFIVEMPNRERCRVLCGSKMEKKQINGSKGILGGRHGDKEKWHEFLIAHRFLIADRAVNGVPPNEIVPEEYQQPGTWHLYVWNPEEFKTELERIGFVATTSVGESHGWRYLRDFRCVGVKP